MGQQPASKRAGTPAPRGKTGGVTSVKQNLNISANNQQGNQTMNKGGTRPITTGTKPNGSRTGTVTKGVTST